MASTSVPSEQPREYSCLLDSVLKRVVTVRGGAAQAGGQIVLPRRGQHHTGLLLIHGLHIQSGREAEGRAARGEPLEVPVREHPIEDERKANKDRAVVSGLL